MVGLGPVRRTRPQMVGARIVIEHGGPSDGAGSLGAGRRRNGCARTRGGAVDHELDGLRAALETEFATNHMPGHTEKLLRADADERHLFICLHVSALPFSVTYGLMSGESLRPSPLHCQRNRESVAGSGLRAARSAVAPPFRVDESPPIRELSTFVKVLALARELYDRLGKVEQQVRQSLG